MNLRRQISEQEKQEIIKRHTRDGILRCFVDNHPIENLEEVEYHHIRPFCEDGPTNLDNIAPVCKEHHRRIRTLSLIEFRDKMKLDRFFEEEYRKSDGVRLDDVFAYLVGESGYGKVVQWERLDRQIKLYWEGDEPEILPLYQCPVTGFEYFYALVPVKHLKNDTELQPRPLEPPRMWELYRHFLRYTQLAPAVCRLVDNQIMLFDGQHKTAAQIWAGRCRVECKVYLDPDKRVIKETVLAAHDKLRQMPFYTSTLISRYSSLFKEDWEEYMERPGTKSEKGFVQFLIKAKGVPKGEAMKRLRAAIENDILEDPENKLQEYIAEKNKSRKNPLTIYAVQQTFLKEFIAPPPLEVEFESTQDFRRQEKKNLIKLLNLIVDKTLSGRWNPEAKNEAHHTAERIYAAGALKAWVPMLRAVIAAKLNLVDDEEKNRVFFRQIDDETFASVIEPVVNRLFSHKIWLDPDPEIDANLRVNNVDHVKQFFKSRGLSAQWLLGIEDD
ncbi:MAG: HNH endonuclease [Thermosediminibacteraceae bacterium]|nr:HNH endonuclease [Thermosediminibacteraceae bacterium]